MDPRKETLQRYAAAMCAHDIEGCVKSYASDAEVNIIPNKDRYVGSSQLREHHRILFEAFPDFFEEIVELLDAGDTIICRVRLGGTHLGVFKGMPGTGYRMESQAALFYKFNDAHEIQTCVEYFDRSTIEEQLGIKRDPTSSHWAKVLVAANHPVVMGRAIFRHLKDK